MKYLEGVVGPEVHRGAAPDTETQDITKRGAHPFVEKHQKRRATDQSGGNGDQKGGTGSRPDASSRDSVRMQRMKAAASKRREDASSRRRRFAQDANVPSSAERATQSQLGKSSSHLSRA
jgi:hypothetical protein